MDDYANELNSAMINVYDLISRLEEQMVSDLSNMKLNIRELHMIEYIADSENGRTLSEIAHQTGITPPSVTIAIQKLQKRGFVEKVKRSTDGRQVHVILTRMGQKINAAHRYYHLKMMRKVAGTLSSEEKDTLLSGLGKLAVFFDATINNNKRNTYL
ncbi:MAG: MarR family transcriptional regulator [Christensenellaceae bacterium]|nr:MarR family transcriptional regulator [Christensenellaceae bacterium]